jgi:zinc-binding alcohol dehydrogenase/oxidoreductase
MKALVLTSEPEIRIQEVEKPVPQQNEVLIKMSAVALNRRDQWVRVGMYPGMAYNCIMGADGCGTIEQLGENVQADWLHKEVVINPNRNWGDNPKHQSNQFNILGMPSNGTFAEYLCINIDRVHLKTSYLTSQEAAAFPLAGLTAYRACFFRGEIKAGDTVLVTGIGGGVAQFAAQFAVAAGANVFVTSGSEAKILKMKELGVQGGAIYTEPDWNKKLLKETGGFDVIIDSAGGDDLNLLIRTLKPAGTLVFYGATLGSPKTLEMPRIFFGQYNIKGTTMGSDAEFVEMLAFIEKYKIKPIVDEKIRPFSEIVEAINDMRDGKIFGKVVVGF